MNTTAPATSSISKDPQGAATAAVKEKRNDNSNPQQGTDSKRGNNGGAMTNNNEPNIISPTTTNSYIKKDYTSSKGLPRPSLKIPPTSKDARKLFVGGLPSDITENEFREFFEQFGTLIDSIVMFDRETNRSRGFGFVSYDDPDVARKLLEMGIDEEGKDDPRPAQQPLVGRMEMRGKIIEIKAAEPKESSFNPNYRRGGQNYNHQQNHRRNNHQVNPHNKSHHPSLQVPVDVDPSSMYGSPPPYDPGHPYYNYPTAAGYAYDPMFMPHQASGAYPVGEAAATSTTYNNMGAAAAADQPGMHPYPAFFYPVMPDYHPSVAPHHHHHPGAAAAPYPYMMPPTGTAGAIAQPGPGHTPADDDGKGGAATQ